MLIQLTEHNQHPVHDRTLAKVDNSDFAICFSVFKGFNSKSLEEEQKREKIREQQLTELNEAANLHKRQIEERKSRFHSFLMKALKSVQDQHQMCMVKWDKWQSPR